MDPAVIESVGRLMAAAIALGFGGLGAAIGMGLVSAHASEGMMRQPASGGHLLRVMLIGQAISSDPPIFALVIGLIILFVPAPPLAASGAALALAALGAGICSGLGCLGSGLGCGWPAKAACEATARNPRQASRISQIMIISQAMTQSPSILATVVSLLLLFVGAGRGESMWGVAGISLGCGLAMGFGGLGPGIGSGLAGRGAVLGAGAWPHSYAVTLRSMLLGQAMVQTPSIFAILVALIMLVNMPESKPGIIEFAKAFGAGLAVGVGGLGPGIGAGFAGDTGGAAVAKNPRISGVVMRTLLIGLAVAQSTAIYALIIALLILYVV